ncbi:unnamed protein product [Rotaria sordida]|uniref:Essential MCU regulator, mitochondrial n=1 Tax=Rotaria sordida TaxID=392033 RepID=A0A814V5A6_9BILA|nr:unnamed protein product [Rotaria sordida]CAF1446101.1 unnamed protein product [Rotaria sordida]
MFLFVPKVFPIIRRHVAATQQALTARTTARSFLIRFIEDRHRKTQQDDVRLELYMLKDVHTEPDATQSMPKRYLLGITKVLLNAIPFLYIGSLVSIYEALGLKKMNLFVYSDNDDNNDD